MKFLFISILLSVFHFNVNAQITHFIYFETENKQPFYIKINGKILSSSSAGYLIVPKLKQGDYKIAFGFPKNEIPEKVISYTVDKKDAGFIIKNFGDKGWGLFNIQTFDVILPGDAIANTKSKPAQQNQDDAFSNMLAAVVNDSTIRQKEVIKKEEQVSNNKTELENENGSLQSSTGGSTTSVSTIKKILNTKNNDGLELIYTDQSDKQSDTIRIFLAAKNSEIKNESPDNVMNNAIKDSAAQENPSQKLPQQSGYDSGRIQSDSATITSAQNQPSKSAMFNSDCKNFASEEDFRKLRKKMTAENDADDMIKLAKKSFKTKCFTTGHIKSLSTLFLKDEGKYNFFDAAYPFVSDSNIFATLESELSDTYYRSRFKAMIHH